MRMSLHVPMGLSLMLVATGVGAQAPGNLYCMSNPSPGTFEFASFELATGLVTPLQTIPISTISSAASACIDLDRGTYHFCTGSTLYSYDADNVLAPVITPLPLPPTVDFTAIEFDRCDSVFIGILHDPPLQVDVVRYDPGTNQFTTLLALPPNTYLLGGGQADLDPATRLYLLQTAAGFIGVDVDQGVLVYDTPITVPSGLIGFGHLAYDCTTQRLVGTAVGTSPEGQYGKFMCELDPATGVATILSNGPSQAGIWKPMLGSSTIDLGTGQFLWSVASDTIAGGNISSGLMNYVQSASMGDLNLIEHFSGCACALSTGLDDGAQSPSWTVFPLPAADRLFIDGADAGAPLLLLDARGRVVLRATGQAGRTTMDVSGLAPGIYLLRSEADAVPVVIAR